MKHNQPSSTINFHPLPIWKTWRPCQLSFSTCRACATASCASLASLMVTAFFSFSWAISPHGWRMAPLCLPRAPEGSGMEKRRYRWWLQLIVEYCNHHSWIVEYCWFAQNLIQWSGSVECPMAIWYDLAIEFAIKMLLRWPQRIICSKINHGKPIEEVQSC